VSEIDELCRERNLIVDKDVYVPERYTKSEGSKEEYHRQIVRQDVSAECPKLV
jgi:hypothetical protein